jgi:hypothetical protein
MSIKTIFTSALLLSIHCLNAQTGSRQDITLEPNSNGDFEIQIEASSEIQNESFSQYKSAKRFFMNIGKVPSGHMGKHTVLLINDSDVNIKVVGAIKNSAAVIWNELPEEIPTKTSYPIIMKYNTTGRLGEFKRNEFENTRLEKSKNGLLY